MKHYLPILTFFLLIVGCSSTTQVQNTISNLSFDGKPVVVYTTADNSELRLSLTDKLNFKKLHSQ